MSLARRLVSLAIVGSVVLIAACAPDVEPRCAEAYDHLIHLAKRSSSAEQRERFMAACRAAWDERQHTCILASRTAEEAMAGRAAKVRPG